MTLVISAATAEHDSDGFLAVVREQKAFQMLVLVVRERHGCGSGYFSSSRFSQSLMCPKVIAADLPRGSDGA